MDYYSGIENWLSAREYDDNPSEVMPDVFDAGGNKLTGSSLKVLGEARARNIAEAEAYGQQREQARRLEEDRSAIRIGEARTVSDINVDTRRRELQLALDFKPRELAVVAAAEDQAARAEFARKEEFRKIQEQRIADSVKSISSAADTSVFMRDVPMLINGARASAARGDVAVARESLRKASDIINGNMEGYNDFRAKAAALASTIGNGDGGVAMKGVKDTVDVIDSLLNGSIYNVQVSRPGRGGAATLGEIIGPGTGDAVDDNRRRIGAEFGNRLSSGVLDALASEDQSSPGLWYVRNYYNAYQDKKTVLETARDPQSMVAAQDAVSKARDDVMFVDRVSAGASYLPKMIPPDKDHPEVRFETGTGKFSDPDEYNRFLSSFMGDKRLSGTRDPVLFKSLADAYVSYREKNGDTAVPPDTWVTEQAKVLDSIASVKTRVPRVGANGMVEKDKNGNNVYDEATVPPDATRLRHAAALVTKVRQLSGSFDLSSALMRTCAGVMDIESKLSAFGAGDIRGSVEDLTGALAQIAQYKASPGSVSLGDTAQRVLNLYETGTQVFGRPGSGFNVFPKSQVFGENVRDASVQAMQDAEQTIFTNMYKKFSDASLDRPGADVSGVAASMKKAAEDEYKAMGMSDATADAAARSALARFFSPGVRGVPEGIKSSLASVIGDAKPESALDILTRAVDVSSPTVTVKDSSGRDIDVPSDRVFSPMQIQKLDANMSLGRAAMTSEKDTNRLSDDDRVEPSALVSVRKALDACAASADSRAAGDGSFKFTDRQRESGAEMIRALQSAPSKSRKFVLNREEESRLGYGDHVYVPATKHALDYITRRWSGEVSDDERNSMARTIRYVLTLPGDRERSSPRDSAPTTDDVRKAMSLASRMIKSDDVDTALSGGLIVSTIVDMLYRTRVLYKTDTFDFGTPSEILSSDKVFSSREYADLASAAADFDKKYPDMSLGYNVGRCVGSKYVDRASQGTLDDYPGQAMAGVISRYNDAIAEAKKTRSVLAEPLTCSFSELFVPGKNGTVEYDPVRIVAIEDYDRFRADQKAKYDARRERDSSPGFQRDAALFDSMCGGSDSLAGMRASVMSMYRDRAAANLPDDAAKDYLAKIAPEVNGAKTPHELQQLAQAAERGPEIVRWATYNAGGLMNRQDAIDVARNKGLANGDVIRTGSDLTALRRLNGATWHAAVMPDKYEAEIKRRQLGLPSGDAGKLMDSVIEQEIKEMRKTDLTVQAKAASVE